MKASQPTQHSEAFWAPLVRQCLLTAPTPFYLFSIEPIRVALAELHKVTDPLPFPTKHWLSLKTQPVRPLLQWWHKQDFGIEVVSEFELLAALREGFLPEKILVNGPAKHHWLPRHPIHGLRVNLDSLQELSFLAPLVKSLDWSLGIRFLTDEEFDPEEPACATQFGLTPDEAAIALKRLLRLELKLETVHFHLRTNVSSISSYQRAFTQVADICRQFRFKPRHLDCGGGWPPHRVRSLAGKPMDHGFDYLGLTSIYASAKDLFPGLQELWLENGRFLSAGSGVLVVKVLDSKIRRGMRHLICDGGRTTQALVSNWEQHELFTLPPRIGPSIRTTIHGPTCMAFDRLARCPQPRSLRPGDHLVWMDAGAYHIPWETRFSHGAAAVLWHEDGRLALAREREPFSSWWAQWDLLRTANQHPHPAAS